HRLRDFVESLGERLCLRGQQVVLAAREEVRAQSHSQFTLTVKQSRGAHARFQPREQIRRQRVIRSKVCVIFSYCFLAHTSIVSRDKRCATGDLTTVQLSSPRRLGSCDAGHRLSSTFRLDNGGPEGSSFFSDQGDSSLHFPLRFRKWLPPQSFLHQE